MILVQRNVPQKMI